MYFRGFNVALIFSRVLESLWRFLPMALKDTVFGFEKQSIRAWKLMNIQFVLFCVTFLWIDQDRGASYAVGMHSL